MFQRNVLINKTSLQCYRCGAISDRSSKSRSLPAPVCAGKGFGSGSQSNQAKAQEKGASSKAKRANKSKGKVQRRMPQPPQQPQGPAIQMQQPDLEAEAQRAGSSVVDEMEFDKRLQALKREAELKKQEALSSSQGGILDTPKKRQQEEDLYSNPPPLSATLLGKKEEGNDEYSGGSFGPGQIALAAASLALVGIFALTNGSSDLEYALSSSGAQQGATRTVELSDAVRAELESQLAKFVTQLEESPGDAQALEGAAVLNAQLGNFQEAVQQLQRLSEVRPTDPDVWRVLAESQASLGDTNAALAAYERAWREVQASPGGVGSGLEVLQGLAGQLVAAGRERQAVEAVEAARGLVAQQAPGRAGEGQEGAGDLGVVEVELLLGKVYSQWKGHTSDALGVYDALTQNRSEDFRGYLAKGLLLREQGRVADAQRAFIQARYLAPRESRPAVENIIGVQR